MTCSGPSSYTNLFVVSRTADLCLWVAVLFSRLGERGGPGCDGSFDVVQRQALEFYASSASIAAQRS